MFQVTFKSVDGAGQYEDVFKTAEDAAIFADSKQAYSDSFDNPYGYSYSVIRRRAYGNWDFVYNTQHGWNHRVA